MNGLKNKERIWYFDLLRIFACICIIVLHVTAISYENVQVGSFSWCVFDVYNSLSRCGVPLFVMISGALFLDPEKEIWIKKLYSGNILHIVTAFLFWSAFYALLDHLNGVRLRTVVSNFLTGGVHLWYLYMIVGLYMIVPLVRRIVRSEKLTAYFLTLSLVFTVGYTTVRSLVASIDPRVAGTIEIVSNEISIKFVCGFTGYFILGHVLRQKEIPKKLRGVIYALGVVGGASTVLMTYLFSRRANGLDQVFLDNFSAGVMLQSVGVFVFFKYHTPAPKSARLQKALLCISKCTFGIYLVHFVFQKYCRVIFRIDPLSFNPVLSIPVITCAVFVVSLIVSWILDRVPIVKKYIV